MTWKQIKKEKPAIALQVLIFTMKTTSYKVGRLRKEENDIFWVLNSGTVKDCNEEDWWMEFEPMTFTKKYD